MRAPDIEYREQSAGAEVIQAHLESCSPRHEPPLAPRVDLRAYALKIQGHATTFEAWADGALVGLVAAYLNDTDTRTGYITNVSVADGYVGRGIASKLMRMCLERAAAAGMQAVKLEVGRGNAAAIALYRKLGFGESGRRDDFITMTLSLAGA
jgi:ribosomal protein S18 acetylase RimI-like enzyme